MSYVPKYVMKRMVLQDAMKKVEGGGQLSLLNLVATIPADQIPGSPLDIMEIKINGEVLSKDEMKKIEITLDDKKIMFEDLRDAGTIPVNTKIIFFLPGDKFVVGEDVTVEVDIPIVSVHIEVTRTVCE
ncbi:MAG: hypothetical protein ACTSUE_17475 [Promethearchaeota archaeon]